MRSRCALLLAAVAALLAAPAAYACHPAQPGGFTKQDLTIPMDDGVSLAATVYEPLDYLRCDHQPVAVPAVMMFHGIGGTRASMNDIAESLFRNQGFAVLTYDARRHRASRGLFSGDGPR